MNKQTLHACVFDLCCACDVIWNGLVELVLASRFSCFAAFNDAPINVIVVIRHYSNLCSDKYFVTGVDKKRREIPLAPIYNALGAMKAAYLPGFHPLWGGGRRHWTICWQGKIDFFESVGRTSLRQWQSTCTFTACWGRTIKTIWSNH